MPSEEIVILLFIEYWIYCKNERPIWLQIKWLKYAVVQKIDIQLMNLGSKFVK
jgi:hypothetical protein